MPGESAGQRSSDRDELRSRALHAAGRAYRPYSGLGVGAAGTAVLDGRTRIVTGCNVENASFGLTLCAECSLVSDLVGTGGGQLTRVVVVDHDGRLLTPCGRCRQLLHEHGGPDLLVDTASGPVRLGALLPAAFGPGDLP